MHFARPLILVMALMAIQTSASFGVYCHARIPEKHTKALTVKDINKALMDAYKEIGGDPETMKEAVGKHYDNTTLLEIDFDSLKIVPSTLDYHVTFCYHHQEGLKHGCAADLSSQELEKIYADTIQGKNITVNNYADNFGSYLVLTLTPSYLEKSNKNGDSEKISATLHVSVLKVRLPKGFSSQTAEVQNKILDRKDRFMRMVYYRLTKKMVDLTDTIACED